MHSIGLFLGYANGWRCVFQEITLLSAAELARGPLHEAVVDGLQNIPEPMDALGRTPQSLLPVAASLEQADIFVMPVDGGDVGSRVLWLAEGELIDTYDSFGEYFASMIAYTNRAVGKLADRR